MPFKMTAEPQVLVIGDMRAGTNSRSLADAFGEAGARTRLVDTSFIFEARFARRILVSRARRVDALASARLIKDVRSATDLFRVDLLVAIKTIYFNQRMLLEIPAANRVHYSFDDVSNKRNLSNSYLRHENLWDLIGTTKQHNVREIKARGGKPLFQWAAYDPHLHKRETDFLDRKYAVGFVGAMREDRASLPQFMSHASDKESAVIAGPRWDRRYPGGYPGVDLLPAQMGPAYTRLANDIQGGLVLLNSENRDQHTNRSIETPATGQLVIAEDTAEHRQLFSNGASALLFSNLAEAAERIREMRMDRYRAARIAEEGYRTISAGGFTYRDRALELMRWSRNT